MSDEPILRVRDLTVGVHRRAVLSGLDFELSAGDVLGIVGPNGCGKTTLLKTLVGALPPLAGRFDWSSAGGGAPRIGYVPQRDAIDSIYPFRALEVVLLAQGADQLFLPTPTRAMRARAAAALERVGLGHRIAAGYSELSGGERQRVLLARALALAPDVLALDEPTSAMDPGGAERLLDRIDEIRREQRLTVVLVSHDLSLVSRRASRILALHEGRHLEGSADDVLTDERLSQLYGYPMRVVAAGGRRAVVPGTESRP